MREFGSDKKLITVSKQNGKEKLKFYPFFGQRFHFIPKFSWQTSQIGANQ